MLPSNFKRRATKIIFPNATLQAQQQQMRARQYHNSNFTQHQQQQNPVAILGSQARPQLPSSSQAAVRQSSTLLPVGVPPQSKTLLNKHTFGVSNPIPPLLASHSSSNTAISEQERQRRQLRQMRCWESTTLGNLVGEPGTNSVGDGTRFTLLNYNILAQVHLDSHGYLYRGCSPAAVDWNFRLHLLFDEISELQPDLICLQEIEAMEFYRTFEPELTFKGYKGVFKKRTRDKPDGCAIFWKNTMFSVLGKLGVEYFQPHIPLLDRDNIGLLVKLQSRIGKRPKLIVGTTHLLYNPKRNDVKLAQVQLLLAELDRFAFSGFSKTGETIYLPTIMCGDFNTEPYSSIIRLITDGELQYIDSGGQRPKLLIKRGMDAFLPPYVGISDQCQHYRVVLERYRQWRKHRRNAFELDLRTQLNFVNLHSTEKHGEYTAVVPPASVVAVNNAQSSGSGLGRLAANFGFADDPDVETMSNTFNNGAISMGSLPSHLNVDLDPKVHAALLDEIYKSGTVCTFESGELSHKLRMRSVYAPKLDRRENNENVATTKQSAWTCVDYIFYGMNWSENESRRVEGNLKLLRRLGLLTRSQCKEFGILPNLVVPSDHYPLVAEFLLK